jgi:hypothetical protein
MTWLLIMVPLMLTGIAIAVTPIVWANLQTRHHGGPR